MNIGKIQSNNRQKQPEKSKPAESEEHVAGWDRDLVAEIDRLLKNPNPPQVILRGNRVSIEETSAAVSEKAIKPTAVMAKFVASQEK